MNLTPKTYGRVVLTGEHSVVYGHPALTAPISLGLETSWDKTKSQSHPYIKKVVSFFCSHFSQIKPTKAIACTGDLPFGSGLSSSTATAISVFKFLAKYFKLILTEEDLFNLVLEFERQFYPVSGMDQAAVAFSCFLKFQKYQDKLEHKKIKTKIFENKDFYLIQSGKPIETTKEMVQIVKDKLDKTESVLENIGKLSHQTIVNLKDNNFEYQLIKENHNLLVKIGVVGFNAQKIIKEIENIGGVGKITGAGGVKSGSGIILAYHPDSEKLENLIKSKHWEYWKIKLAE